MKEVLILVCPFCGKGLGHIYVPLFWEIVGPILKYFRTSISNGFEIFDGRCIPSFARMCSFSIVDNPVFHCACFADIGASVMSYVIRFLSFQDRIQLKFFLAVAS